ncbi:ATP-binding protein [Streptomyces sp. NPDC014802]|jgi:anti-sigma regulatory factor (Ser/Thr protein kinase)|uniref:ATP-binding protein n=1 Tax=unclassified Streptomyces TaxID=2593676 RepID=UPI0036F5A424
MDPVNSATGGEDVADREPMRESVTLDGGGGCIAEARRRAAGFLTRMREEYGVAVSDRAMDITRLVVSELVTNARKYAPGPVLMELAVAGGLVEVVVRDGDPELPVARAADPSRVGQHGLEIVMAVVQQFEAQREPTGKRVTARIALADPSQEERAGRQRPVGARLPAGRHRGAGR